MAFCIQCGEDIELETEQCPKCGRLVGASSIGIALERRPSRAKLDAVRLAAIAVLVLLLGTAVFVWGGSGDTVGNDELLDATRRAAPHLVRVRSSSGDPVDHGGVCVRVTAAGPVVATAAAVGKPGSRALVVVNGETRDGVVLLAGQDRTSVGLAFVLVPGAKLEPVAVALQPVVDAPVLALNANATLANPGRALSLGEDGVFVHDAPLNEMGRGFGLFDRQGALVGWPSVDPIAGESLALGANALLGRLVVQEFRVPAGSQWIEPTISVPADAALAFVPMGGLDREPAVRFGDGKEVRATPIDGTQLVRGQRKGTGPLQLGRVAGASTKQPLVFVLVAWLRAATP